MARRIVVMERTLQTNNDNLVNYAFWNDVPAARQTFYANAAFVTAVIDATTAEKTALTSGAVVESLHQQTWPAGSTVVTMKADLVAGWNAEQARIAAYNPWSVYGTSYDSATTAWTNKTVA